MAPITLSQTTTPKNNKTTTKAATEPKKPKTGRPLCETCGKINHSTEKCYFGANATKTPPPGHKRSEGPNQVQQRDNQSDSKEITQTAARNLK